MVAPILTEPHPTPALTNPPIHPPIEVDSSSMENETVSPLPPSTVMFENIAPPAKPDSHLRGPSSEESKVVRANSHACQLTSNSTSALSLNCGIESAHDETWTSAMPLAL